MVFSLNLEDVNDSSLMEEFMPENRVTEDPKEKHNKPPYPTQQQQPPGTEAQMSPKADHGEQSYRGANRLEGKTALITGGDSGIGRAVAIAFAREGANVSISYLNEHDDANVTAHWVKEAGRKAVKIPGDIGNEDHCKRIVEQTVRECGQLDILVNNAAFQMTHQTLEEWTAEEIEHTFRTNIISMFYLCKAAVPHLKPGSVIINTSSIQAYDPNPQLLAYAATKGAIANFTKGLAKMLGKQGIRVNAVAPGPVWTPLIPSTMPEQKVEKFGADTILGRAAQPAEMAPIYAFLASSEASYVSGEVYGATGGQTPL
jgi:NAD(P)-dependent dehydrogenase (short-subunit alcohol dehydrogenase family)